MASLSQAFDLGWWNEPFRLGEPAASPWRVGFQPLPCSASPCVHTAATRPTIPARTPQPFAFRSQPSALRTTSPLRSGRRLWRPLGGDDVLLAGRHGSTELAKVGAAATEKHHPSPSYEPLPFSLPCQHGPTNATLMTPAWRRMARVANASRYWSRRKRWVNRPLRSSRLSRSRSKTTS